MSGPDRNWVIKVLRFITRDEVKTPLAFLYKLVPYLVATLLIVLYAPIPDGMKMTVLGWAYAALLGVGVVVMLFAWCRPKNLVYGETGHRAEYQIDFGTDTRPRAHKELEVLQSESNPELPQIEQK
jgi:hypothetical protein